MIIICIIAFLLLLFILIKISRNDFFFQEIEVLQKKRELLVLLLIDMRFEYYDIEFRFLKAFDFFCENPTLFDGETIVKDLDTIFNLSAAGMVHDYEYFNIDFFSISGLIKKIKVDIQYGKDQELTGKGIIIPYTRSAMLILSTPLYLFYLLIIKRLKK